MGKGLERWEVCVREGRVGTSRDSVVLDPSSFCWGKGYRRGRLFVFVSVLLTRMAGKRNRGGAIEGRGERRRRRRVREEDMETIRLLREQVR